MSYRATIKANDYETGSYTEFYYHFFRNTLLVGIPLVIISALILSLPHSSANNSGSDTLTLTLSSSCTMSSVVDIAHNGSLTSGTYIQNIGQTTIKTLCNDGNGYSIYAVGYSNNEEGNNKLINSEYPQYSIDTGLNTSGLTSQWAMKLNNIPDDPSPTPPTIESDYNNVYGIVPPYWTKVAGRQSGTTDMAEGSSFTTTYAVYASSSQYAGTYQGQVKYLLTHPATQNSQLFMQDVVAIKNNLSNVGDSMQVVDQRDGKKYWVTRLADGNVWMTQNLDLEIDATRTYTHNDTDLGWDPNSFDSNATWKPDTTNGKYNLPVNGTSVPGWSNQNNYPYSADPGDVYYYTSNSEANDIKYNSLSECIAANHTEGDCKHYHAGNYYNWTAAIASNDSASISAYNTRVTDSICPKGWRLPNASTTNNEYNEFGRLLYRDYGYDIVTSPSNGTNPVNYQLNGFNALRSEPLYFVLPGGINAGTLYEGGYYWSNTLDYSSAYFLHLYTNGVNLADKSLQKMVGLSVRCLAR